MRNAANQHIRMISEGLCDTKDLINFSLYCIFDQINAALLSIRDLF